MGSPDYIPPYPDRIIEDAGFSFCLGAVGASPFHFLKGVYSSPRGARLVGGSQAVRMNAPRVGGRMAAWIGLYSVLNFSLVHFRQEEDPWGHIICAAAANGTFHLRQGIGAASRYAVLGGAVMVLVQGADIMLDAASADREARMNAAAGAKRKLPGTFDSPSPFPPNFEFK